MKTTKVTDKQRGLFFQYVESIGKEACYDMLKIVTRCESLRDSRLSSGMMGDVLLSLELDYPNALEGPKRPKVTRSKKKTIPLISRDKKEAIRTLCGNLTMKPDQYRSLCRQTIGKDEPMTEQEGADMIQILSQRVRQGFDRRRQEVWSRIQVLNNSLKKR